MFTSTTKTVLCVLSLVSLAGVCSADYCRYCTDSYNGCKGEDEDWAGWSTKSSDTSNCCGSLNKDVCGPVWYDTLVTIFDDEDKPIGDCVCGNEWIHAGPESLASWNPQCEGYFKDPADKWFGGNVCDHEVTAEEAEGCSVDKTVFDAQPGSKTCNYCKVDLAEKACNEEENPVCLEPEDYCGTVCEKSLTCEDCRNDAGWVGEQHEFESIVPVCGEVSTDSGSGSGSGSGSYGYGYGPGSGSYGSYGYGWSPQGYGAAFYGLEEIDVEEDLLDLALNNQIIEESLLQVEIAKKQVVERAALQTKSDTGDICGPPGTNQGFDLTKRIFHSMRAGEIVGDVWLAWLSSCIIDLIAAIAGSSKVKEIIMGFVKLFGGVLSSILDFYVFIKCYGDLGAAGAGCDALNGVVSAICGHLQYQCAEKQAAYDNLFASGFVQELMGDTQIDDPPRWKDVLCNSINKLSLAPCCHDGIQMLDTETSFGPGKFVARLFTGECGKSLVGEIFKAAFQKFFTAWLTKKLIKTAPLLIAKLGLMVGLGPVGAVGKTLAIVYRMAPCIMYGLKIAFKECLGAVQDWIMSGVNRYKQADAVTGSFGACERRFYTAICGDGVWNRYEAHYGTNAAGQRQLIVGDNIPGNKPQMDLINRENKQQFCGQSTSQLKEMCLGEKFSEKMGRAFNPWLGSDPREAESCHDEKRFNPKALFWVGCKPKNEGKVVMSFFDTCRTQYLDGPCNLVYQDEPPQEMQPWFKREKKIKERFAEQWPTMSQEERNKTLKHGALFVRNQADGLVGLGLTGKDSCNRGADKNAASKTFDAIYMATQRYAPQPVVDMYQEDSPLQHKTEGEFLREKNWDTEGIYYYGLFDNIYGQDWSG